MLRQKRLELILNLVEKNRYVTLTDLKQSLKSSESTIRGDLVELEKEGKIIRLHGGAQVIDSVSISNEKDMDEKENLESDAKHLIGKYAATLVQDKSLIYVDAGTSTKIMCEYFEVDQVTIVTNSSSIARVLKQKGYKVYVTGGEFKLTTDAFIGSFTLETLKRFNFDMGFFGTNGVSLEQGFTTPDYEEAIVKQKAISKCKKAFVLADHTKFDVESAVQFASLEDAKIICDYCNNKEYGKSNIIEVIKK